MPQAIQIDGRFRFVGNAHDVFIIQTRTDGVTTNPWGEFDTGIRFSAAIQWDHGPVVDNIGITRNAWPGGLNDLVRGTFSIVMNTFYDFRVIDTGSLLQFFIGDLTTPLIVCAHHRHPLAGARKAWVRPG